MGGRLVAPFAAVAANGDLRRVVLAYVGFNIGEWATWVAVLVYAFEQGGTAEASLVALAQLAPAAIVAPLAATLGDRLPRERALLLGYVIQAVAMAATALALLTGAPRFVVYAAAAMTATSITLTRPAHGSILPSLARTPGELTAANVVSGTVASASLLVAPALAGLLMESTGAASVFLLTAAGCTLAAVLVAGIRIARTSELSTLPSVSPLAEITAGFRALVSLGSPRTVILLVAAGALIEGATDIFIVLLALDILALGESGAGYMNSAVGAGGLLGATAAVWLVGRVRLAAPLAAGLVLTGLPLALAGLLPSAAVAFVGFALVGLGRSLADVAARTLLQRVTPDLVLTRVFGVLEGLHNAVIAVGTVTVPVLVVLAGPRGALIAVALWMPVVVLVVWRALVRADRSGVVHVRELQLLRGLPMFAPLPPPMIERLSARLEPVVVPDGAWVVRQGEPGDRYYIIDRGHVDILVDGRQVRTQGPGEGFGEIALIRDVARTASVRAHGEAGLYALDRDVFLAALAGYPEGRRAAERVSDDRLAMAVDDAGR